jgi:hypothetical protein
VTVSREARPLIGFQQADAAPTSKAPFEIYFDPFRGSTFEGRSGAIPIGPGTAYGHYKFSVAGRGADGGECPALDPEIIVTQ